MKQKHPSDPIHALSPLLFQMRQIIRARVGEGGAVDPYRWLRLEVLRFLSEHRDASLHDISTFLCTSDPSASSLAGTLMRGGFVRRASGADRRFARFALTAKGRKELSRVRGKATRALGSVFGVLLPSQRRDLVALLDRVVEKNRSVR
ncbi:MAG: winged helix DNA-binding protein [Patescibacteria group bacterium]|nr:winged helix DNA-binding protein [Patescibacteria group bacterium]